MREILFRGQDAVTREWIYGCYVDNRDRGRCPPIIVPKNGNPHIYVVPETVGQFTGLTDKNGKKIFEGDIFTSDYFKNGLEFEVVFSDGSFCGKCYRTGLFPLGFTNDYYETGDDDDDFYYPEDYTSHIQIIGNIHDNPEMLT